MPPPNRVTDPAILAQLNGTADAPTAPPPGPRPTPRAPQIGAPVLTFPEKPTPPPSGYRAGPNGSLEPIPGGPADKPTGEDAPSGYRWSADGVTLEPIPGGPASGGGRQGRAMRQGDADKLETQINAYDYLRDSVANFQDAYAGNAITGELENWLQGKIGTGTEGQRQWWANFRTADNQIRNALFGASLTEGEKQAYERTTIDPSMTPETVRNNLKQRIDVARDILRRRVGRLYSVYNKEELEAALGEYQADLLGPDAPAEDPAPLGTRMGFGEPEAMGEIPEALLDAARESGTISPELQAAAEAAAPPGQKFTGWSKNEDGTPYPTYGTSIEDMRPENGDGGLLQTIDAGMRGAADIVTLGHADEIAAAGDTLFGGGTMAENLNRQRGIDRFDEENNFEARLAGQFGGALLLPGPKSAGFARNTGVGAAYGAGYGFGSANGDLGDRLAGAGTGAAVGGATAGVLGALGKYVKRPPGGGGGAGGAYPRATAQEATDLAADTGIPIMTSDAIPPRTFMGKGLQNLTENIPFAGTGGKRAAQQEAREQAVRDVLEEYGGTAAETAIDSVMSDLSSQRQAALTNWTNVKNGIKRRVAEAGPVQMSRTVQALSQQIAALKRIDTAASRAVVDRLRDWRMALTNKGIDEIEAIRKEMGAAFTAPELAAARDTGEKAVNAIYNPIRDDIAAYVERAAGAEAGAQWRAANKNLARMAGELRGGGLRRVLQTGEATPEDVGKLLFSAKPSELRTLYNGLSETGRANARAAIMQRVFDKLGGEIEEISPDRFLSELKRVGKPMEVFFEGADANRVRGLVRALQLTRRAGQAAANPPTGRQNLPFLMGLSVPLTGGATAALGATIGALARVYESAAVRTALLKLSRSKAGTADETTALRELQGAIAGQSRASTTARAPANDTAAPRAAAAQ